MSESAYLHRQLAAAAAERADWLRAAVEWERACQLDPEDFDTRYQLAVALASSAQFDKVLDQLNLLAERGLRLEVLLLRGDVFRALGDASQAAANYRQAQQQQALPPRRQLLLVETLLNSDQLEAAGELLQEVREKDSAAGRLTAAAFAQAAGRPDEALRNLEPLLTHGPPLGPQAVRRLLCLAATYPRISGMPAALERVPAATRDDVYWQLRGNVLVEAGANDDALRAWSRVRDAATGLAESREVLARRVLASLQEEFSTPLTIEAVLTVSREKVASLLTARAELSGWSDPACCHNWALFHLAEGNRRAEAGQYEEALNDWKRSIAFVTITLSDTNYLCRWANKGCQTYRLAMPHRPATLVSKYVTRHFETCFEAWSARLIEMKQSELAARMADLALILRAELRAVQLLQSIGGAPLGPTREQGCVGPEFATLMGWQTGLLEFLSGLPVKRPKEPRKLPGADADSSEWMGVLLDFDAEDEDDPAAVEAETKLELERLFGGFRLPALLESRGEVSSALKRLREQRCEGEHAAEARRFEASLLLKLAEKEFVSEARQIERVVGHWRKALALVPAGDQRAQAVARIQESATVRAGDLSKNGQLDESIDLLEAVYEFGSDVALARGLGRAYANRGIQQGNAGDWEQAVADLRRARQLDDDSRHTNTNLITALRGLAGECCLSNRPRTCELLKEAQAIAEQCLESSPADAQLREMIESLQTEIASMCDFEFDDGFDQRLDDFLSFDE